MKLKQPDTLLLKSLLLISVGIIVAQALGMHVITSYLFLMTFPLTVLLWMRSVRKTLTGTDLQVLMTIVLACIAVVVNLGIHGKMVGLSYFKKLIMFIMTMLFWQTAYRMKIDSALCRYVDGLVDFLSLFLIGIYFLNTSSMYLLNGFITNYLTFRFANPNTTGLFLACLFMLELYRIFTREHGLLKLIHVGISVMLGWFILRTQSRNALLVIVFFTATCVWLEFRSRRRLHVTKFWANVIAWSPMIFAGAYTLMIYSSWVQNLFGFLVDVGKKLESRMGIWTEAWNAIRRASLFGDYYGVSDGTGTFQLHNSHLDLAVSYGIPVLILVCSLLGVYLHQKGRFYDDKESFSYILGFGCAIMLGLGEAALFSGGLGIYIFAGLFLLLSGREKENGETV